MPVDVALHILIDTLNGLHAAHELKGVDRQTLNLVHRDVSPQNVIVGRDGTARLTDFGVAKARVRIHSTRSTQLKGKLAYLAPEQLGEQPIDRRADIFAAGVVLWEALTGRRLFKAATEAALVKKLVDGAQQSPRELCPDVPAAVDAACMKALSFDPADRYPTAAMFADALEDAAAADGIRIASSRIVADYLRSLPLALPSASVPPPAAGETTPLSVPSLSSSRGGVELTEAGMAHTRDSTPPKRRRAPKALIALGVLAALVVAGVVVLRPKINSDAAALPPQPAAQPATDPSTPPAPDTASAQASAAPEPLTEEQLASASAKAKATASAASANATAATPPPPSGPIKPWVRPKAHSDYRPDDL